MIAFAGGFLAIWWSAFFGKKASNVFLVYAVICLGLEDWSFFWFLTVMVMFAGLYAGVLDD